MDCRVHVKGKLRSCRFGPEADGQHGGFRTRLCSIYLCEEVMHSRPWLARLAAMPGVLPVQFMQMFCSNGVKLRLDFAVADQRYGNHKQRRANDPQPEEPTSPIHCSAKYGLPANSRAAN